MMSFITEHVVSLVCKEIELKGHLTNRFYYFNEPIRDRENNKIIDRVSVTKPYELEKILPVEWSEISPKIILDIYDRIKSNDFYFYKVIEGKSYKARLK